MSGLLGRAAALALALLLVGCVQTPRAPSPFEQAALARQMARFEAARSFDIPDAAELYAAEIIVRFPASTEARTLREQWPGLRAAAEQRRAERRRAALWRYTAAEHPRGLQLMAELSSEPQHEMPPVRLVLRRHPRFGQSAYLLIEGGADFACQRVCTLQLVFDQATVRPFVARRALDNVPPALFLRDDRAFYDAIETADDLRVDLPLASGARVSYRFDIGGYQPGRMSDDA